MLVKFFRSLWGLADGSVTAKEFWQILEEDLPAYLPWVFGSGVFAGGMLEGISYTVAVSAAIAVGLLFQIRRDTRVLRVNHAPSLPIKDDVEEEGKEEKDMKEHLSERMRSHFVEAWDNMSFLYCTVFYHDVNKNSDIVLLDQNRGRSVFYLYYVRDLVSPRRVSRLTLDKLVEALAGILKDYEGYICELLRLSERKKIDLDQYREFSRLLELHNNLIDDVRKLGVRSQFWVLDNGFVNRMNTLAEEDKRLLPKEKAK